MSSITFGIIVFPGSNCDHDAHYVAGNILQQNARLIWHKEGSLGDVDVVILPGGFSYGDYLRCGAIARFSPIMKDVVRFAKSGGVVIGICNGFQILTEAGLLPGALLRNKSLQFICRTVPLRIETTSSRFTNQCTQGEVIHIPIAHGDGNYFADEETIRHLEDNGRVLFRYCDDDGNVTPEANPNGSINNIAGIMNEEGNVLGMMPHPERASDCVLRLTDGLKIFSSALNSFGIEAPAINLFEKERSVING
jgi:phosphoribosylformylglycinamidine synthase